MSMGCEHPYRTQGQEPEKEEKPSEVDLTFLVAIMNLISRLERQCAEMDRATTLYQQTNDEWSLLESVWRSACARMKLDPDTARRMLRARGA